MGLSWGLCTVTQRGSVLGTSRMSNTRIIKRGYTWSPLQVAKCISSVLKHRIVPQTSLPQSTDEENQASKTLSNSTRSRTDARIPTCCHSYKGYM